MTTDEHMATAKMMNVPISTRQSVEISSAIRGRSLQKAKEFLQRVIEMKEAVPYKRFKMNVAHKPGPIAAGRYPQKSSGMFLALLNSVESNAEGKGLDKEKLYIHTVIANKASRGYRPGRRRGIKARNTHLEIIVAEREQLQKKEQQVKKQTETKTSVQAQQQPKEMQQEKPKKEVKAQQNTKKKEIK